MCDICSDICECCQSVQNIVTTLNKKLFSKVILNCQPEIGASQDASPSDVQYEYGITVNIQPTKLMNKKQWKTYTPEKQIAQLSRIEASFRRDNPSVKLCEIHYETCPRLKNVHFHALYRMPAQYLSTMQNYYARVIGSTGTQSDPWRHLDVQEIYDAPGWIKYIRKDKK